MDTVKDGYFEEFMENVKEVIGDKKIDYVIVQHTELDHSGSLKKLIELYPEIIVVGSNAAINYCKNIVNMEFNSRIAKEDLSLGEYTLKFISAPNLHWPDTIFTYVEKAKMLFTCDVFGSHYCPINCITDACSGDYYEEMKYYFDVIMGPFKKFVNMALDRVKDLEFDMVAPSHGPIHVDDINKSFELYREWSKEESVEPKSIAILYISAYGNTEKVAKYFENKLSENGFKAVAHDITEIGVAEAAALVEKSTGVLVGSPTINQDAVEPAWDLLAHVGAITNRGKIAGAFGSYGWSGEGVPMMTERLRSLKLKVVEPGFRFKFVPSEMDYKEADEFINKYMEMFQ